MKAPNAGPVARSLLFVPGDRPDRFDKAAASGAHQIILDLEDGVAPASKANARASVAAWLAAGKPAVVRVNAADTDRFGDDLALVRAMPAAMLMLSKADSRSLTEAAQALPGRPLIALLETVKGFVGLRQLAGVPGLARIAFGSVDFGVETGIADEGEAMTALRTQIVLESCFAGLAPPVDGVSLGFDDDASMRGFALRSRQLGFGGKLCIHPKQVSAVNAAFRPNSAQVQWARRVLAAFEASAGSATSVDGVMVDKPVVERARHVVEEAGAEAP
jgi:citrate lyase subunit beta/citryl-CoA lyase